MPGEEKAAEELAKLGQQALQTSEKAGGWVDTVFGGGFRQLGIAFEESMAGFRTRNRLRVLQKTQDAIEASGMGKNTRPLEERIAIPMWEAISEESDDGVQDVWAAYIRNAVDPKCPKPDRVYLNIIRTLSPGDWPMVRRLLDHLNDNVTIENFEGYSAEDTLDGLDRLSVLGLLEYDDPTSAAVFSGSSHMSVKVQMGDSRYYATKLFRKLGAAIAPATNNVETSNS